MIYKGILETDIGLFHDFIYFTDSLTDNGFKLGQNVYCCVHRNFGDWFGTSVEVRQGHLPVTETIQRVYEIEYESCS